MRPLIAMLFLLTPLAAQEIPAGKMPVIDGIPTEKEWSGARAFPTPLGSARVLVADGALCIAVEMKAPYQGERIDISVSDPAGRNYIRHALHPASHLPDYPYLPVAPLLVYRSSYRKRDTAFVDAPRECRVRARVFPAPGGWTIEAAISLDALSLSAPGEHHLLIESVPPFGGGAPVAFTPRSDAVPGPKGWMTFRTPAGEEIAYRTPDEDAFRSIESRIFSDRIAMLAGKPGKETLVADAFDGKKNNKQVEEILKTLRAAVKADSEDLFARYFLVRLLRRSNRLSAAAKELDRTFTDIAYAEDYEPILAERFELLFSLGHFAEAARAAKRIGLPALIEAAGSSGHLWQEELRFRTRDRSLKLPRVHLKTTQGPVVLELFDDDPAARAYFEDAVRRKRLDGAEFVRVVGGASAEAPFGGDRALPPPGVRRHWRGSVSVFVEQSGKPRILFSTKRTHWLDGKATVVGRVVEGLSAVDAMEYESRIERATLPARDGDRE